jgi:hypothetical protein
VNVLLLAATVVVLGGVATALTATGGYRSAVLAGEPAVTVASHAAWSPARSRRAHRHLRAHALALMCRIHVVG